MIDVSQKPKMIPLHEPYFDADDFRAVTETLQSTWVSTGGETVDLFEKEMAAFTGCSHAVAVANGTLGLQLMLETLKRQKGITEPFEVLVPALSFAATANAVIHAGGTPVFMDTGPKLMNVSPEAIPGILEGLYHFDKLTQQWKSRNTNRVLLAVLVAHIMGWACDLERLQAVCQEMNITLFEDAAESLGVYSNRGRHTGSVGLAGCFSFNGNKILTTGGGGMIVTNDSEFAARAKHLSTTAKSDPIHNIHDEVGYNYRLVGLLAALGRSQLLKLPKFLEAKTSIFHQYQKAFAESGISVHCENSCRPNYWLVNIVLRDKAERDTVLQGLIHNGIQARPLWTPIPRQPAYEREQMRTSFPNVEWVWERCLSLPSSPFLPESDLEFVVKSVIKNIKGVV